MKMKKILIIFFLTTSIGFMLSCGNRLDIPPRNDVDESQVLTTSGDVQSLLVGAYDLLGDGDLYGGNILRDGELLADPGNNSENSELTWAGTFVAPGEIYRKRLLVNNDQAESTWIDAYRTINACNLVLANLNLVTNAEKARVEGEAKFIRGVLYFELVRLYAKTWVDGDPAANPGVPLVLTPATQETLGNQPSRNSVAEVYAQILKDLQDAEDLLPEENGFFATKWAAAAILSRVYLMQNNYAGARDAANRVIASDYYSLENNFRDAFNQASTPGRNLSEEDIFSIQVTPQDGTNNMWTFLGPTGRGDIYAVEGHFDLYESGDVRAGFFEDDYTSKWSNQFGNINIIRLAEMYLTRAEANFRLGTAVGATPLADINLIRERAGLEGRTSLTLAQVLRERRLELAFEGHWIHDKKRTKTEIFEGATLDDGEVLPAIPFNSPRVVYPIPQRERDVNPNLTQNPGYTQ